MLVRSFVRTRLRGPKFSDRHAKSIDALRASIIIGYASDFRLITTGTAMTLTFLHTYGLPFDPSTRHYSCKPARDTNRDCNLESLKPKIVDSRNSWLARRARWSHCSVMFLEEKNALVMLYCFW
jgi:hypothetical protein